MIRRARFIALDARFSGNAPPRVYQYPRAFGDKRGIGRTPQDFAESVAIQRSTVALKPRVRAHPHAPRLMRHAILDPFARALCRITPVMFSDEIFNRAFGYAPVRRPLARSTKIACRATPTDIPPKCQPHSARCDAPSGKRHVFLRTAAAPTQRQRHEAPIRAQTPRPGALRRPGAAGHKNANSLRRNFCGRELPGIRKTWCAETEIQRRLQTSGQQTHPTQLRAEHTAAKSPAQLRSSASPGRATPPTRRRGVPPSIPNSEPLAMKLRLFDFIHHSHREILRGNVALALIVHQQLIGPGAMMSRARARSDQRRRAYRGPIELRHSRFAKYVQRLAMRQRNPFPLGREVRRVH